MPRKPARVFLDMDMPIIDGAELLQALRKTPGLFWTPVILTTGYGNDFDGMPPDYDDLLTKPIKSAALLEKLREYLPPAAENKTSESKRGSSILR